MLATSRFVDACGSGSELDSWCTPYDVVGRDDCSVTGADGWLKTVDARGVGVVEAAITCDISVLIAESRWENGFARLSVGEDEYWDCSAATTERDTVDALELVEVATAFETSVVLGEPPGGFGERNNEELGKSVFEYTGLAVVDSAV